MALHAVSHALTVAVCTHPDTHDYYLILSYLTIIAFLHYHCIPTYTHIHTIMPKQNPKYHIYRTGAYTTATWHDTFIRWCIDIGALIFTISFSAWFLVGPALLYVLYFYSTVQVLAWLGVALSFSSVTLFVFVQYGSFSDDVITPSFSFLLGIIYGVIACYAFMYSSYLTWWSR